MTQPLHQQLGGLPRLGPVVDELVDRHAANPALAPRFRGQDLPQLKALSLALFQSAPPLSELAGLETTELAHVGMRFDAQEFAAVVDDVIVTLREHGYRPGEVDAVVQLLRRANQGFRAAPARAPTAALPSWQLVCS